jgi:RNA polymerase sigma-70 factor (ECF subfamily)
VGPTPETSDPDLVAAMARGDGQALGVLYDRHSATLLATAVRILGNQREAEDLVHDVLMEAWQKSGDYDRARGSVRTWLLVRLRSRALDRWRRAGRTRTLTMEDSNQGDLSPVDTSDPGQSIDHARVRRAVQELPEAQRQVLELAYFEGLSSTEIAERLAIPVGTVKSRTAAGLAKLRAAIHDTAPASPVSLARGLR